MRSDYKKIFKAFCQRRIPAVRRGKGLTHARMADILCMDTRSYAGIEHGESSCGGLTLALFLIYCCPDPLAFLAELKAVFEDAKHAA